MYVDFIWWVREWWLINEREKEKKKKKRRNKKKEEQEEERKKVARSQLIMLVIPVIKLPPTLFNLLWESWHLHPSCITYITLHPGIYCDTFIQCHCLDDLYILYVLYVMAVPKMLTCDMRNVSIIFCSEMFLLTSETWSKDEYLRCTCIP